MKKFFSLLAIALVSVSVFASRYVAPNGATLSEYKDHDDDILVCFYFEGSVCYDIVFSGSYNNWSTDPSECEYFEPVEGYDGWYVVSFRDNSSVIEGKPVELTADGDFSWELQIGDAVTVVSGDVTVKPGKESGEVDIVHSDYTRARLGEDPCSSQFFYFDYSTTSSATMVGAASIVSS